MCDWLMVMIPKYVWNDNLCKMDTPVQHTRVELLSN